MSWKANRVHFVTIILRKEPQILTTTEMKILERYILKLAVHLT